MISTPIAPLLGNGVTEADVIKAYSLDHADFPARPHLGSPDRKTRTVNGDFFTRDVACQNAGLFNRSIYRIGAGTVVKHERIFVREDYRRRGIAKAHLTELLRFYDALGIEYVHMDAIDWGPVVWPQFGFGFQEPGAMGPLHEIFRALYEAETGSAPGAYSAVIRPAK